jgi:hypothetical protein
LAVKNIQERIKDVRTQVLAKLDEITNHKRKAQEAKAIELQNEFGIMEGSLLVVEVKRASGLRRSPSGEMPSPFVVLMCEGRSEKTKVKPRTSEPVWDELINFQIKHGTSDLLLAVMNQEGPPSNNNLGDFSYNLSQLSDQKKRDEVLTLSGGGSGQLILSMRWIFNKAMVFEEMARQVQNQIALQRSEIDSLRQRLNLLHMPFSIFGPYYDWIILEHPSIKSSEVAIFNEFDTYAHQRLGRELPWRNLMEFCVGLFLCLACLSMLIRPDFPNLCLALAVYFIVSTDDRRFKHFKYFSLAVLLSELYDFAWLFFFCTVSLT